MKIQKILIILVIILLLVIMAVGTYLLTRQKRPVTPQSSTKSYNSTSVKTVMIRLLPQGFSPSTLTTKKGTLVVWMNQSGKKGSVNSSSQNLSPFLELGEVDTGSNLQWEANQTGTFTYQNRLNPTQTGTLIVK